MNFEEKIRELSRRVEKLEEENRELRQRNSRLQKQVEKRDKQEQSKVSRRKFLKMLGVGAGGLAFSSAVSGVGWSVIQPQSSGTSDIKSSTVADGAITSSKISSGAVDTSNISDSAVSTAKLGFDTATQNELDNHASNSGVHHSRPTSTSSATAGLQPAGRSGQSTEFAKFDGGNSDIYNAGDKFVVPMGGRYSEIAINNSSQYDIEGTFTATYADGSTTTGEAPSSSTQWFSLDSSKTLVYVTFSDRGGDVVGVNPLTPASHSHSI